MSALGNTKECAYVQSMADLGTGGPGRRADSVLPPDEEIVAAAGKVHFPIGVCTLLNLTPPIDNEHTCHPELVEGSHSRPKPLIGRFFDFATLRSE